MKQATAIFSGKVVLSFILGALFPLSAALAAPGDTLAVGSPAEPARLVDQDTGQSYGFAIVAAEGQNSGGDVTFGLQGPAIALCTTHGPAAVINPNPTPEGQFNGNAPLQQIGCGSAHSQFVSLKDCVARIEAHGYVHSDHPQDVVYMGTTTIDIRYQKARDADELQVTVYTPKKPIKLIGKVPTDNVAMSSCR